MSSRAVAVVAIAAFCLASFTPVFAQGAPPAASSPWLMPGAPASPAPTYPAATSTYPAATYPAPPATYPASTYPAPTATYPAAAVPAAESRAPRAQKPPRDFHFDLGVGTEFPISVGGVLTAELPHRFLLQVGAGVMPKAYAETIDGFLTSVGAYDALVSPAVRASLADSFVLRASVGGRPFSGHGFEILGGYTLIKGGGSLATADAINAILAETGYPIQAPSSLGADIPIGATLHNFHASIGWRWLVADDRLVLRASLSYLQTVSSQIAVDIPDAATEVVPYEGQINEQVNAFLGPFFSKYGKAPTLGLSAAFRF